MAETGMILVGLLGLLIGLMAGYGLIKKTQASKEKDSLAKAQKKAEEMVFEAKKEAIQIKNDAKREMKEELSQLTKTFEQTTSTTRNDLNNQLQNLRKREKELDKKGLQVEQTQKDLEAERKKALEEVVIERRKIQESIDTFEMKKKRYEELHNEVNIKLSQISQMSKDEAVEELKKSVLEEASLRASKMIKQIEDDAKEQAEDKAKRLIAMAISRYSSEFVSEKSVSLVKLPSDEVKGRLIGREGRNIRALEAAVGVDLIVDDTPESVVVSSFDPVRRQVAKMTIERLVGDGRIHPTRIEETVVQVRKEVEQQIKELGEKAAQELKITGVHPEILRLVGILNFRTSYTQNQLHHAIECSYICGMMAAELGVNVNIARRAALLHDIGKAIDHEVEGGHAVIGADFAKRYGEKPEVVHAIRAHHEDEKPSTLLAFLVQASDALSGARPGARSERAENYIQRLGDLEKIANSFDGVSRSFALQAGRELRVLVENEDIDDESALKLSQDIARRIENEVAYPGQVKVTVIRETRAVSIAK